MTMPDTVGCNDTAAPPGAAVSARFPATANQARIWRQAMSLPGGGAFNVAFRRRLEGRISDAAIERALQAIVDRHEILRTRFAMNGDGALTQEVLARLQFKFDQVDLRPFPEADRDAEMTRLGAAEAIQPFDIDGTRAEAPLFRVLLIRMSHDLAVLHLTFHQLIIDGWSIDLINQEFGEVAAAHDQGRAPQLSPVELQFGDYARWQKDVLASDALDGDRAYWRKVLGGMVPFQVPPDRPDGVRGGPSQIRSILLPKSLTAAFDGLARTNRQSLASFATAAGAAALHLVTGANEITLGVHLAGREDRDSEGIVGPLINRVILRIRPEPGDSFLDFAHRVDAVQGEAIDHGQLPFAEVANIAGLDRAPGGAIGVDLMVQRTQISDASLASRDHGDFRVISGTSHPVVSPMDLTLFMVGREEGWRLSCEAQQGLYDTATVDALLAVWRKVIEGAVARADRPLADLCKVEPHERRPVAPASNRDDAPVQRANPRIEALRKRIQPLQPRGDGAAILAINNSSVLYPVARAIGTDNPFFDLQFCPSAQRVELPSRHFTDHARDAVEMIRLARPHGPYVLFGLCVCGAVAIEAARILQSEGEEVPLVALNDTYRPGYRERMPWRDALIRRWQVRLRTFRELRKRYKAGELSLIEFIDNYRLLRWVRRSPLLSRLGPAAIRGDHDAMQAHGRWFIEDVLLPSQAGLAFKPYRGRVVLFRNVKFEEGRLFPRDFGWTGHVDGQFEVVDCPGTHDTMFRTEGAAVIGRQIREILGENGV
ncbi:MAG: hypothetical protein KGM18_13925 [Sphingomonadales bacterium]|nr:hypothetical protein [Sphingomonadales bacterium]